MLTFRKLPGEAAEEVSRTPQPRRARITEPSPGNLSLRGFPVRGHVIFTAARKQIAGPGPRRPLPFDTDGGGWIAYFHTENSCRAEKG
jgi:hypothetical protein